MKAISAVFKAGSSLGPSTVEVERIRRLGMHLLLGLPIGESRHSVELNLYIYHVIIICNIHCNKYLCNMTLMQLT